MPKTKYSGGYVIRWSRGALQLHPQFLALQFAPPVWHDAVIIVTVNNVSLPYFVASIEMIENP